MLSRLKKNITVTIRVRNLVILAVCIAVLLLGAYLRVPDNLFFMLLEPDQVQTAYVLCRTIPLELTQEETETMVALLNNVRIIGSGDRLHPYNIQLDYDLQLQLKNGTWLRFDFSTTTGYLLINGYRYADIADTARPLHQFCSEKSEECRKLHPLVKP